MQANNQMSGTNQHGASSIEDGLEIWVTPHEKRLLFSLSPGGAGKFNPKRPFSSNDQRLPEDWIYENIKDAIYHCRRIYYIYLGILGYTLLTILTTPTLGFFREQIIQMPIMNAQISLNYYLLIAPVLLIGFFTYKQLYLSKTNKLIKFAVDKCKVINQEPSGACCDRVDDCSLNSLCDYHLSRLYPWLIVFYRFVDNKPDSDTRNDGIGRLIDKLQQLFVSFSLWWLLPIILLLLSLFVIKKHSVFLSAYMLSVTCVGMAAVAFFRCHQQQVLGRTGSKRSPVGGIVATVAMWGIVSLLVAGNMIAFNGKLGHAGLWLEENKLSLLFTAVRSFVFADLSKQTIAQDPHADLAYWIDLEARHFEGANLSKTRLNRANLRHSHLSHASLVQADLEKADLYRSQANGADFSEAILNGGLLAFTQLVSADFTNAKLRGADFSEARLAGSHFTCADLSEAIFEYARADNADFLDANLQYANLRTIQGIQVDQIKVSRNYRLAYYRQDWILQLGLPQDHNQRVEIRRFSGYDFEKAVLCQADLKGADLTGARFNDADLRGASLRNADITAAILINADFQGADLRGINYSNIDQFLKVKTLYKAQLDKDIKKALVGHAPHLFAKPLQTDWNAVAPDP